MSAEYVNPTSSTEACCDSCGFALFIPVFTLSVSTLGLYDDSRSPGRCLLSLSEHYEYLDEMPASLLTELMKDIHRASQAIKDVTGSRRVNVAVLGNTEPHVHAHLIPRYSGEEQFPSGNLLKESSGNVMLASDVRDSLIVTLSASLFARGFPS